MSGKLFDENEFAAVARRAVAEGVVLLKNDGDVLPLQKGTTISLFGRSQYNYYKSGTGSGGMVNTKYVIGVKEALEADDRYNLNQDLKAIYDEWIKENPFDAGIGWASEPWFQKEMVITPEIAKAAAAKSDVAIVLIGRTAGEDQDNSATEGSYLLTEDEHTMLKNVTEAFEKTIVLLNVGNIIDMKWVKKYNPSAVAYIWQGGQEGGNGVLDVLSGDVNPAGRLSDTIAYDIDDYPSTANFGKKKRNIQQEDIYVGYRYFETFAKDKVLYPFGFGLSYTSFDIKCKSLEFDITNGATVVATVTNTGSRKGQQVVQLYLEKPQGKLGNPSRVLVGFDKTKEIEPGETVECEIHVPTYYMSCYDDSGVTGHKSAYVLEQGTYTFYVGGDVRAEESASVDISETVVVDQKSELMAPPIEYTRVKPEINADGTFSVVYEAVPTATKSSVEHRQEELPTEITQTGDKGYKLVDVAKGRVSMDDFIAQLSDDDLVAIVRGEGMSSPKVTPGTGGAFGGVTDSLLGYGIPVACCTDGPSGIRMDSGKKAFAMPNGTLLASSWNLELMEELYKWEGLELRKNKVDVLLGPGMNLHRNPLNGRNFEYFSEDPFLTGKCAAYQLKGMHKYHITGTIKHFALNTQETSRHYAEHVASERAIRELYLKGYEIAVKEAGAHAVMTTYGPVNGRYTSSNFDLVTKILRDEWGFEGIVMTDWWAKGGNAGAGDGADMADIVAAQNDLYMVTTSAADNTNNDNSLEGLANGTVTRADYQRCAANICRFIISKPVFFRLINENNEIDNQLLDEADEEELSYDNMIDCNFKESDVFAVDPAEIKTGRDSANMLSVAIKERGDYRLTMTVRAKNLSALAQIPLTVFRDRDIVKTITLTGEDREWQTVSVDFADCFASFYIKLYFAQDGMEIKDVNVEFVCSKEQEIHDMLARLGED
ncbi:beta-glucosidase [Pseudobutyrivibrio sp. JW11]|uniref:glycoside hydrolase family 3 protein n=1 Tax=Pseudobutyrivibrio sp. JW11 TaxID=1855302 RepID=UPI0008E68315|nr:glycoside hydrolase family 3 protein [Pseudobutyrivibrio sp. JW11]SFO44108.1 beta-glucosidase [Pseudobutyrivibrio sp. JW11]